jgi:histidinol-phosphate aminotransferase
MISPRAEIALMEGYHSPQLDVDVRLNTNESPEPPPAAWVARAGSLAGDIDWHRYPDRSAVALRSAIGQLHGVGPEQVFVANGSNEVLQCLLLAYGGPDRCAALWEPTYALHAHISRLTGTEVVSGERAADFSLDVAAVERTIAAHRPSVAFLCSPNNPTGMVDPPSVIQAVLDAVSAVDGLLVVDEAYGQFAEHSALALIDEQAPLVVTRTFSKTWAMAGARLGYLVGPSPVVEQCWKVALPYHLDAYKQALGVSALAHVAEMEGRVARLVAERERLVAAMEALGLHVWPSGANFVLFRPAGSAPADASAATDAAADGDRVWAALVDQGVLVRNCSSWPRLAGCLRATVGTPAENDALVAALGRVLAPTP